VWIAAPILGVLLFATIVGVPTAVTIWLLVLSLLGAIPVVGPWSSPAPVSSDREPWHCTPYRATFATNPNPPWQHRLLRSD
jgi:hypothetical protein